MIPFTVEFTRDSELQAFIETHHGRVIEVRNYGKKKKRRKSLVTVELPDDMMDIITLANAGVTEFVCMMQNFIDGTTSLDVILVHAVLHFRARQVNWHLEPSLN